MIKFRIFFEADAVRRRINVNNVDGNANLFDQLRAKILPTIPADQDVGLHWFDSAGCKILCENEEELRIAVEECPSAASGVVELSAVLRQPKPRPLGPLRLDSAGVEVGAPEAGKSKKKKKRRPYALLPKTKVCEICGYAFPGITHLAAHMRTHTGERPFACDLCDKTFQTNYNLRKHLNGHYGFEPFKCPFPNCKYEARVSSYLHEHMMQMHGPRTTESQDRGLHQEKRAIEPGRSAKGKKKRVVDFQEEVKSGDVDDAPIVREEVETPSRVLRSSKRTDHSAEAVQQR